MRINIRLPPRLRAHLIMGTVTDPGGRPVSGAFIWLGAESDPADVNADRMSPMVSVATSDAQGHFAMYVMAAAKGWIHASLTEESSGAQRYAIPLPLDHPTGPSDITLVIAARW